MADQSDRRKPDLHGHTRKMDAATLVMAEHLEGRGRHPFFLAALGEYMDHLAPAGPEAIIDIGCGTAVAARAIARRSKVSGPVTAIDISPPLVGAGQRLAEAEGLGGRIDSVRAPRTGSACPTAASTW